MLLSDITRFVEGFLLREGAGAVFLLERESGPGFLQLAITRRLADHEDVEFGLPDAVWSRNHFDLVHAAMENAGHTCSVEVNPEKIRIHSS